MITHAECMPTHCIWRHSLGALEFDSPKTIDISVLLELSPTHPVFLHEFHYILCGDNYLPDNSNRGNCRSMRSDGPAIRQPQIQFWHPMLKIWLAFVACHFLCCDNNKIIDISPHTIAQRLIHCRFTGVRESCRTLACSWSPNHLWLIILEPHHFSWYVALTTSLPEALGPYVYTDKVVYPFLSPFFPLSSLLFFFFFLS